MEMTYDTLLRPSWSPARQCDNIIYSIFGLNSTGFVPNDLALDLNALCSSKHLLRRFKFVC